MDSAKPHLWFTASTLPKQNRVVMGLRAVLMITGLCLELLLTTSLWQFAKGIFHYTALKVNKINEIKRSSLCWNLKCQLELVLVQVDHLVRAQNHWCQGWRFNPGRVITCSWITLPYQVDVSFGWGKIPRCPNKSWNRGGLCRGLECSY